MRFRFEESANEILVILDKRIIKAYQLLPDSFTPAELKQECKRFGLELSKDQAYKILKAMLAMSMVARESGKRYRKIYRWFANWIRGVLYNKIRNVELVASEVKQVEQETNTEG